MLTKSLNNVLLKIWGNPWTLTFFPYWFTFTLLPPCSLSLALGQQQPPAPISLSAPFSWFNSNWLAPPESHNHKLPQYIKGCTYQYSPMAIVSSKNHPRCSRLRWRGGRAWRPQRRWEEAATLGGRGSVENPLDRVKGRGRGLRSFIRPLIQKLNFWSTP